MLHDVIASLAHFLCLCAVFPLTAVRAEVTCGAKPTKRFCRTERLLPHDAVPRLNDRLLQRDALPHVCAGKPFRIRTYEKCARKAFGICTCKIIGLKVSWNEHLQKMWRCPPPCLLQSSFANRCSSVRSSVVTSLGFFACSFTSFALFTGHGDR